MKSIVKSISTPEIKSSSYIEAKWPVPAKVRAYTTTRIGGYSLAPFDSFNLAKHVEDVVQRVSRNRQRLIRDLDLKQVPSWLEQTHSSKVVDLDSLDNQSFHGKSSPVLLADASFSAQLERVCVVMTADCLPILFANKSGSWVAAVHAGWRGLADGIVQNTIAAYPGEASELVAWLGPAISQRHFEVGEEVKSLFEQKDSSYSTAFEATGLSKYHCDLYQVARILMKAYGIGVFGGEFCSFSQSSQFYSYRRDGKTGRMASLIWIEKEG